MNSLLRACPLAVILASLSYTAGNYLTPPLTFEWRGAFMAHVSGHTVAFGASGTIYEGFPLRETTLQFAGARPNVRPLAAGPQTGIANYFLGSHPGEWRTSVPLFNRIEYANLYEGVDLIYYGNQNRLEYDLVVAPGAAWRSIRLAFRGAQTIAIDGHGDLKIQTAAGWITHGRPVIYQRASGGRQEISGNYVLHGGNEVGFEIGAYDASRELIIDPTLAYTSYLGGVGDDYGHAVAIDGSGCAYVVGETESQNFPLLNPEQSSMAGSSNVFVTKFNAAGTGILYSTYIGGNNRDVAMGIAVDAAGNAYVTGYTYSGNFPTTSGALRTSFVGDSKAFILKLNPAGNALVYSTFLGGSGDDYGVAIAVDSAGEAHVAGYTSSVDFPTTTSAFQSYYGGGSYDGFLAKLNAAGSALVFATYLGGMANDTAAGVALDPSGNVYVTGQTQSSNFPVLNAVQPANSESDAFVVKMNASGQIAYATYLGGTGLNNGTGIAADAAGNAYVTGFTDAPDFPVTAGAYQIANNGSYNAFVAVLNASGNNIVSATYLGGSGPDVSYGIALDGSGNVYIAGSTNSMNFPMQASVQPNYSGGGDAFAAGFNNQLSSLLYSTYFGGSGSDVAAGIAVDSAGDAYITGWTSSGESSVGLPITPGAYQPTGRGGLDAFVAKISLSGSALTCGTSAPQVLAVQAGSNSQIVGDFLLNCSGGTLGTQVTANIQAILNTYAAGGSQAELFVGSNTAPILGTASGSSILFSGVSFAAPGPSASIALRITNVSANVESLVVGQQVIMTGSAANATASITVTPAQQTVAVAQNVAAVQLQQLVLSQSSPSGCVAPAPASTFLVSDPQAVVWFQVANTFTGDVAKVVWNAPSQSAYQTYSYTVTTGGTQCLSNPIAISRGPIPMAGAWSVAVYWNNTLIATAPFVVSTAGVLQLIYQNQATGQVNADYYGGSGGSVFQGWMCLSCGIDVTDWQVKAVADFTGSGLPDLIYQNTQSGQVNVDYYGGVSGNSFTGWACLSCGISTTDWHLVGAADFDGNGVPDLVYQNTQTNQVNVDYYGGANGTTLIGWACISCGIDTTDWQVVGVADFDGNGVPDLVYQNTQTGQVNVDYYGGSGGAVFQGWACLSCGIDTSSWQVKAVVDLNGSGSPDLIYQNTTTSQVNVDYYGGTRGAVFQGWACLSCGIDVSGWSVVGAY
jgi:hypothetical protein